MVFSKILSGFLYHPPRSSQRFYLLCFVSLCVLLKDFYLSYFLYFVSSLTPPVALLRPYLHFEQVLGLGLHLQGPGQGQEAALVHVEAPVLVARHDVEGEGRSVFGRVPVRHHQLQHATAQWLSLL